MYVKNVNSSNILSNRLKYEEHISLPGSSTLPPPFRPHSRLTQRDSSRTKYFDGQ